MYKIFANAINNYDREQFKYMLEEEKHFAPIIYNCMSHKVLVCKIPLLARALGLKAKRARDDRVSCTQIRLSHGALSFLLTITAN